VLDGFTDTHIINANNNTDRETDNMEHVTKETGVFFDIARDAVEGHKQSEEHLLNLMNEALPFETRFKLKLKRRQGWTTQVQFLHGIARELTKVKQQRIRYVKQLEPLHIEF